MAITPQVYYHGLRSFHQGAMVAKQSKTCWPVTLVLPSREAERL